MEKRPLAGLLWKEALWFVFYLLKVLNDRSFGGLLKRRPSTGLLWRDRPCEGLLWVLNGLYEIENIATLVVYHK